MNLETIQNTGLAAACRAAGESCRPLGNCLCVERKGTIDLVTEAGFFVAEEAGAVVTDFSNIAFTVEKNEILASNGKIHMEMLSLMELDDNI